MNRIPLSGFRIYYIQLLSLGISTTSSHPGLAERWLAAEGQESSAHTGLAAAKVTPQAGDREGEAAQRLL